MNERTIRRIVEFLAVHPNATVLEIRVALALRPAEVHWALGCLARADVAA